MPQPCMQHWISQYPLRPPFIVADIISSIPSPSILFLFSLLHLHRVNDVGSAEGEAEGDPSSATEGRRWEVWRRYSEFDLLKTFLTAVYPHVSMCERAGVCMHVVCKCICVCMCECEWVFCELMCAFRILLASVSNF